MARKEDRKQPDDYNTGDVPPGRTTGGDPPPTPTHELNVGEIMEALKRVASPRPQQRGRTQTEILTIDAAGTAKLDVMLPFNAQAVRVDNLSSRWIYLRAGNFDEYVPPYWKGRTASIGTHTERGTVDQTAPGTTPNPAPITGEVVLVTWYETEQDEVDGEGAQQVGAPVVPAATEALAVSKVGKASPGILRGIDGLVSGIATATWVQVHNTIAQPGAGAVPIHTIPIAASNTADQPFSLAPLNELFSVGVTVALSTTRGTFTAAAAGLWVVIDVS